MKWETALSLLLEREVVELNGTMLVVRLPGRTGADKHSALMRLLAGFHWDGEAGDPALWAFAMGASILLSPRGRGDILVFLDSSTKTIPSVYTPHMEAAR